MAGVEKHGKQVRIYFNYKFAGDASTTKCRERVGLNTPEILKLAEAKAALIQAEIDAGQFNYADHFPKSKRLQETTLEPFLTLFLQKKKQEVAPSTYRRYFGIVNVHLMPKWGTRQADKIDGLELEEWKNTELVALHNKTIRDILSVLRLTYALYRKRYPATIDPTQDMRVNLPDSEDPEIFTLEEIQAIEITATEKRQELNLIRFMLWTGCRSSEALAVTWEDIDLSAKTCLFRLAVTRGHYKVTKTRRSKRMHELIKYAVEVLTDQYRYTGGNKPVEIEYTDRDNKTIRKIKRNFVFNSTRLDAPVKDEGMIRKYFFQEHLDNAGIEYKPPGQCRHTYISQMLSIDMSIEWIASQVGHTTPEMIRRRYGKYIKQKKVSRNAIAEQQFDALMSDEQSQ